VDVLRAGQTFFRQCDDAGVKSNLASTDEPLLFPSAEDWAKWLAKNYERSGGVWLRLAKKNASSRSVTYAEALDEALCYGWIDGQKRPESEDFWLQRFLPRSAKSLWSKINCGKAQALIEQGRMQSQGLKAIDDAKASGRWESAYDSPSTATTPADFAAALDASPKAKAFFESLNKANRYALIWRIQTAKKAETRARKIEQFIGMLTRGEKIH
jgi:uncharacterized protein YdeI (YjbR/CyaY-like superfamily)